MFYWFLTEKINILLLFYCAFKKVGGRIFCGEASTGRPVQRTVFIPKQVKIKGGSLKLLFNISVFSFKGTEVKAITYSAMQIHDKEKPEIFAIVDI